MSYKPPKQTIVDNDLKNSPSNEAVFEALKLKLPKPSIDGTSGQLLSRGATANDTSWVNPPGGLPNGAAEHQVLVYDGATATWAYAGLGDGTLGTGNIVLGRSNPGFTGTYNCLIGDGVGNTAGSGSYNTVVGSYNAGYSLGNGSYNTMLGATAGNAQNGNGSIFIGYFAGVNSVASDSVIIGNQCVGNTSVSKIVAIGPGTNAGNNSISIGYGAGGLSTGTKNILLGYTAGDSITTGSNNTIIGDFAGSTTLADTTIIGAGTTQHIKIVPNSIMIGNGASNSGGSPYYEVAIGPNASTTNHEGTAIGGGAYVSQWATALGSQAYANSQSMALGMQASTAGLSYVCAMGSANAYIGTLYLGRGAAEQTTANSVKIMTQRASIDPLNPNVDLSEGTLTLAGSQSTGNREGGDVIIATAPAGSSGSSLNAHVERLRVTAAGNVGIGTSSPSFRLEVNADTSTDMLKLISNTHSYSLSRDNSTGNLKFTGSQTGFVGYTFSSPGGDRLTIAGNGNVTVAENLTVSKQSTLTGIVGVGIAPATGVALNILGATDSDQLRIGNAGGSLYYQMGRESNEGYLVFNGNQTNYSGYIFKEDGSEVFRIGRDKNIKATGGDISIETVGKGLAIKSGANAKIGTAQLTAQTTVQVNTTALTANSLIFLTGQDGNDAFSVQNKDPINGTFEIHHGGGNITATVAWMIVEAT